MQSEYILDCVPFNEKYDDDSNLSWKKSYIRKWLNEDFYKNAFNEDEKKQIIQSCIKEVTVEGYPDFDSGKFDEEKNNGDIKDFVCCLDYKLTREIGRRAKLTKYVVDKIKTNKIPNIKPNVDDYFSYVTSTIKIDNGRIVTNEDFDDIKYNYHLVCPFITVKKEFVDKYFKSLDTNLVEVSDTLLFGKYYASSGKKEDIEWNVVNVKDNKATLITKDIIDCIKFSDKKTATWENSYIRKWLNKDFYDSVFESDDKKLIVKNKLKNKKNPNKLVDGGKDTEDFVFLYHPNDSYDFDLSNFDMTTATKFAVKNGLKKYHDGKYAWWTRTISSENKTTAVIGLGNIVSQSYYGSYDNKVGNSSNVCDKCGVRPMITILVNK